jgi:hypothetical protein
VSVWGGGYGVAPSIHAHRQTLARGIESRTPDPLRVAEAVPGGFGEGAAGSACCGQELEQGQKP